MRGAQARICSAAPSYESMSFTEPRPAPTFSGRIVRALGWLLRALGAVCGALLIGWAALAINFSNLPWPWLRLALAVAFAAFGIWALWITRRPRMPWVFAALFLVVCAWWATILPSHDRDWRRDVALMPHAYIDGDSVRIVGVRDFEYRSRNDFTERYKERVVSLSHLTGVDFYVSFWMEGPIGHTFLSFVFDNAPPVSVSIETRPEVGEGYSPLASMFKQYELIYVVGEERDLVRLRTNYRDEEVFLYHLAISREAARRLFLVYLERINELYEHAEWYHLLSNSCTINIVRYANASGRTGGLDFRHVLNGLIDRYFYETGLVNTALPFDELRRRSNITATSQAAGSGDDYPQRIRENLPPARP
jgi:hypothetical protein